MWIHRLGSICWNEWGRLSHFAQPVSYGCRAVRIVDGLQQGKRQRHHLLDPRTGEPAQTDLWSVTVVADRCEQVEVAAKVAFVLGSKEGVTFLRDRQLAGLLIRVDGTWEATDAWPVQLMVEQV